MILNNVNYNVSFNKHKNAQQFVYCHRYRNPALSFGEVYPTVKKSPNDKVNTIGFYQSCTNFFRDKEVLIHLKKLLTQYFPEGTHIADFGCSNGKETYSIAMLLEDINKSKKYKMTGYDTNKKQLQRAKSGEVLIHSDLSPDSFLLKSQLDPETIYYRDLFNRYFAKTGEIDKSTEVFINCFADIHHFKVNKNKFDGIITGFEEGNIAEIDQLCRKEETGVVVFKHAFYHLMKKQHGNGNCKPSDYVKKKKNLRSVLDKIREILPENGLLVIGADCLDHVVGNYAGKTGIITDSPFHKELYKCGFEPLLETVEPVQAEDTLGLTNIKVPTIWKKSNKPHSSLFGSF